MREHETPAGLKAGEEHQMQKLTDWNVTIITESNTEVYKFHTAKEAEAFATGQKATYRLWGIDVQATVTPNTYTLP